MIAHNQHNWPELTLRMLNPRKLPHTFHAVVTPVMARFILANLNPLNRSLRQKKVSSLASEMTEGNWILNPHGLIFDNEKVLLDGQHRLEGIVSSGIPQVLAIAVGYETRLRGVIDTGLRRTVHDCLTLTNRDLSQAKEGILRAFYRRYSHRFTADFIWAMYMLRKDAVDFAVDNLGTNSVAKGVSSAVTGSCIVAAYKFEPHERLAEFCDVLRHGVCTSETDIAAIKLRDWLGKRSLSGEKNRAEMVPKIRSAINQFCRRSTSKSIRIVHGLYEEDLSKDVTCDVQYQEPASV